MTAADERMRAYKNNAGNERLVEKARQEDVQHRIHEAAEEALNEGASLYSEPEFNPSEDLSTETDRDRVYREVRKRFLSMIEPHIGGIISEALSRGRATVDFGGDTEADRLEGIALRIAMLRKDSHGLLVGSNDGSIAVDGGTRTKLWEAALAARTELDLDTQLHDAENNAEKAALRAEFGDEMDETMALANAAMEEMTADDTHGGSRSYRRGRDSTPMVMIGAASACVLALTVLSML
jgi:hypothetical protein